MPAVSVFKKHLDSSIINMPSSGETAGLDDHCSSLPIEIVLFCFIFQE